MQIMNYGGGGGHELFIPVLVGVVGEGEFLKNKSAPPLINNDCS